MRRSSSTSRGGLSAIADLHGAVAPLAQELHDRADAARRRAELDAAVSVVPAPPPPVMALPACDAADIGAATRADGARPPRARRHAPDSHLDPADLVVIVGSAELGPAVRAATRFDLELDGAPSAASVAELAWLCGLVTYERTGYRGRWVDTATRSEVPECELSARYAAAVAARVGIRPLEDGGLVAAAGSPAFAPVALPSELRFEVETEEHARSFEAAGATARARRGRRDDGTCCCVPERRSACRARSPQPPRCGPATDRPRPRALRDPGRPARRPPIRWRS